MEGGESRQFSNDVFKSCKYEITVLQMMAKADPVPITTNTAMDSELFYSFV